MIMKKKLVGLILVALVVVSLNGVVSAQMTGDDVLDRVKEAIDANSAKLNLQMELYNKSGSKRARKLKAISKDGKQDKALIRFLAPSSVEGTGFLSLGKGNNKEDMYLYLPALGMPRKIAGSQKNGSFVGTDFTYNDLSILGGGNYKEDYNATIIADNDQKYVLKLAPTDKDIDYKYGKMWVKKDNWFPVKVEFYNQQEEVEKVLTTKDIEQIDGYWTAGQMTMKNLQQGTKTILYLQDVTYDQSIKDRIFTTRYLKRY